MSSNAITQLERAAAAVGREALDGGTDDAALLASVAALHRVEAVVQAEKLRRVAELDARKAWKGQARDTADLLVQQLGVSRGEATAEARTATGLEQLPQTAARFRAGEIGAEQATEAARRLAEFGKLAEQGVELPADAASRLDAYVADRGPVLDRVQLRRELDAFSQQLTQDALGEKEAAAHVRRKAFIRTDADGTTRLFVRVGAIGGAKIRAALGALAKSDGAEDARSREQRMADAVLEVFDRALQTDLPQVAARRPHGLLITTPEALHGHPDADPAHLDGHGPVSPRTAAQICCDAEVTVVVRDADGATLDARPLRRNPTRAQRAAVIARDRVCVGCGAEAGRCEIHHIHWVTRGGRTVTDNLCVVCWNCHHRIHHDNWVVARDDDGTFCLRPPGWDRHSR